MCVKNGEITKYLEEAKRGKSPEEQERYDQAAKALTKASAGVNEKDAHHAELYADEQAGQGFAKEQAELKQIAANHGNEDAFVYTGGDAKSDWASYNNDWINRGFGAIETAYGMATVVVGSTEVAVSGGAPTPIGVTGYLTVGLGSSMIADGMTNATGVSQNNEGAKVLASYKTPMPSYAGEKSLEIAIVKVHNFGSRNI